MLFFRLRRILPCSRFSITLNQSPTWKRKNESIRLNCVENTANMKTSWSWNVDLEEAEKYAIEHNFTQSKKESYVHSQRIKSYQSFPSGHSATAFCGFTFMALYLCGKIHMWSVQQGYIQGSTKPKLLQGNLWKILFVCLPILAASLIAVSRTRDYHHNYSDIVAGSALGVFSACIVYFSYFNPLTAENSDLPKHY